MKHNKQYEIKYHGISVKSYLETYMLLKKLQKSSCKTINGPVYKQM